MPAAGTPLTCTPKHHGLNFLFFAMLLHHSLELFSLLHSLAWITNKIRLTAAQVEVPLLMENRPGAMSSCNLIAIKACQPCQCA